MSKKMNSRIAVALYVVVLACTLTACAFLKPIARAAIDVALAACIEENPDITSEPEMATVCRYAPDVAPLVKDLLAARVRGLVKRANRGDAGAPDAGH